MLSAGLEDDNLSAMSSMPSVPEFIVELNVRWNGPPGPKKLIDRELAFRGRSIGEIGLVCQIEFDLIMFWWQLTG